MSYYLGVDLGGTRVRAALGDEDGKIIRRADALTHREQGTEAVVERICQMVDEAAGDLKAEVEAVAVGAPGPLDPVTGILHQPPNLTGEDVPLKAMMEPRLGLTVHVQNDANVAGIGEWLYGGHGHTDNLVYITISTGVGAGVIAQGQLIDGFNHTAGEIGHTVIDLNGPPCNCGNRGCVEAICSGTNITRAAREALQAGESSAMLELAGGDISKVTTEHVVDAAWKGDTVAQRVFFYAADCMGIAVVNAIHMFSPEVVVIGGGVSQAGDLLFGPIRDRVQRTAMKFPARGVRVVPAGLGVDSGLVGAVAFAKLATKKQVENKHGA